jgi:serine/threonine protein kinase
MTDGEAGYRIADYEVVRSLTERRTGGRAGVLTARPPARLGSGPAEVVLHLIDTDRERLAAAADHLRAVAAARADHVVGLIEVGRDDSGPTPVAYCAVEYQPWGSLAGTARLETGAALRALAGAARGAHELHEAGLVHGDIRPATVLLSDTRGGVLAAPLPTTSSYPGLTATADPPGRLETLEPALLMGDAPGRASDVWALGATAHRALTGRSLHPSLETDDPLTAAQRCLFEPPVLDPGLAADHADVIARCLRADPVDRPESAAALADAFQGLAGPR